MHLLSNKELANISGGDKSLWVIIGGALSFLAGVFSGFFSISCR